MKIRPIGKSILISIDKEPAPETGKIFIPKTNKDEKFKECIVLAFGKDCHIDIKVGDKICLKPYNEAFLSYETKDKLFYITTPESVLGVIEDE